MRVILDANVVIAAVASRGLCEAIVELCLDHHHLVFCDEILDEIEEKLRSKLKVAPAVVAELLDILRHNAEVLRPEEIAAKCCRDPHDLKVLGLVVPGRDEAIVTGDKDLLVIGESEGARIMTPRGFWESNKKHVKNGSKLSL